MLPLAKPVFESLPILGDSSAEGGHPPGRARQVNALSEVASFCVFCRSMLAPGEFTVTTVSDPARNAPAPAIACVMAPVDTSVSEPVPASTAYGAPAAPERLVAPTL